MPPTGDLAHNPGMCPDWESNQWPFGTQAGAQSTEPHQPGLDLFKSNKYFCHSLGDGSCSKHFANNLFNPCYDYCDPAILQIGKLRLRELKWFVQGHTVVLGHSPHSGKDWKAESL